MNPSTMLTTTIPISVASSTVAPYRSRMIAARKGVVANAIIIGRPSIPINVA